MASPYRDYFIEYAPKPIPLRGADWDWWHKEYDGPGGQRCGTARSVEEAMALIDEQHEESLDG